MEYCCHVWAGTPSCYLKLVDKLQKWTCGTVGPSRATSLEPLAYRQNVASLRIFYWYYFGNVHLVKVIRYSDRLHDFSVAIPRCYKDVYVRSFFPRTAKPWNCLPLECFPLIYDLSDVKSRINRHVFGFNSTINRHLLAVGSF